MRAARFVLPGFYVVFGCVSIGMSVLAVVLGHGPPLDSIESDVVASYQRTLCVLSLFGVAMLSLITPVVLRSTRKPGSVCLKCGSTQVIIGKK